MTSQTLASDYLSAQSTWLDALRARFGIYSHDLRGSDDPGDPLRLAFNRYIAARDAFQAAA